MALVSHIVKNLNIFGVCGSILIVLSPLFSEMNVLYDRNQNWAMSNVNIDFVFPNMDDGSHIVKNQNFSKSCVPGSILTVLSPLQCLWASLYFNWRSGSFRVFLSKLTNLSIKVQWSLFWCIVFRSPEQANGYWLNLTSETCRVNQRNNKPA